LEGTSVKVGNVLSEGERGGNLRFVSTSGDIFLLGNVETLGSTGSVLGSIEVKASNGSIFVTGSKVSSKGDTGAYSSLLSLESDVGNVDIRSTVESIAANGGLNDIKVSAGKDVLIRANSSLTTNHDFLMIVDTLFPNPPSIGDGTLFMDRSAYIVGQNSLKIYLGKFFDNQVYGTLNGVSYTATFPLPPNSQYGIYYPNGNFTSPYTVFYKIPFDELDFLTRSGVAYFTSEIFYDLSRFHRDSIYEGDYSIFEDKSKRDEKQEKDRREYSNIGKRRFFIYQTFPFDSGRFFPKEKDNK
jgi:hypothetical protein